MRQYGYLERESRKIQERNDCAVKAVAILCNASYGEAHLVLTKLGRKRRRSTPTCLTLQAIRKLGCHHSDKLPCPAKTVRHLPSYPFQGDG